MMTTNSPPKDSAPITIGHKLSGAFERVEEHIRERAYQIFLGRKPGEGNPVMDWLEAQTEVMRSVDLAVKEQKKAIVVEGNLKGFTPKEVEIEVGANALKVFGSHTESNTRKKAGATCSSSGTVHFYQAVPLPCEVDADASEAKFLKNGKLKITLPKKAASR